MEYSHTPVLLAEAIQLLSLSPGIIVVDATIGAAGHASEVIAAITPGGTLVGLDVDDAAIVAAEHILAPFGQHNRIELVRTSYADLDKALIGLDIGPVDAMVFDLGVSSEHLDRPERGFSYRAEGPLDMRMDRRQELNAAAVVNTYSEQDLTRIISEYGEERYARRVARTIAEARKRRHIETTTELAEIVVGAIPAAARRHGPHPARRTFQAIRIEVNRELVNLERGLEAAVRWVRPGGRIACISYQSLEDRIVKRFFAQEAAPCICPPDIPACGCGKIPRLRVVTRRPVKPNEKEMEENPRARSARLRAAERT